MVGWMRELAELQQLPSSSQTAPLHRQIRGLTPRGGEVCWIEASRGGEHLPVGCRCAWLYERPSLYESQLLPKGQVHRCPRYWQKPQMTALPHTLPFRAHRCLSHESSALAPVLG